MLRRLLSNDYPNSRILLALILLVCLGLLIVPIAFPSAKALNIAAKILIFIVLVASFDLLLGYTGILSFAHTMFFGIGAYGVAIASTRLGGTWTALILGSLAALAISMALALIIALFSLRIKAIFFAMVTLAVASSVHTLAMQMPSLTGGDDGITFRLPAQLSPGKVQFDMGATAIMVDGRTLCYFVLLALTVMLFLSLLRIVNSPFGRVLQAIRENEFRAEAVGYPVLAYRTLASVISAFVATIAGIMLAVWLRYTGPETTVNFEIMLDVLLILVIGGMGTIYGAVVGTVIFMIAQSYLQNVLALFSAATLSLPPMWQALASPQRWLLWLGLIFILTVYFLPGGVVGKLRARQKQAATANKHSPN